MKWDWNDWKQMPFEKAEGKKCEAYSFGGKYILPSGRVIRLDLNHESTDWRFDFEVIYPNTDQECRATPGKLVFYKHSVFGDCGRPARYFNEDGDGLQWMCGICRGREELPPDRPTLTIEMLEAVTDEREAALTSLN